MDSLRIFISYSHEDRDLVEKLVDIVERGGHIPLWDRSFQWGRGFDGQIREFITHSHVFMPLITTSSSARGWVHQEIGFAVAHRIPVLPVCLGSLPGEMIQLLHAVEWDGSTEKLEKELSKERLFSLVDWATTDVGALYECGNFQEDRTELMAQKAESAIKLGLPGMVRQSGGLSSFHIPDRPLSDPIWKERYGHFEPNEKRCQLLRRERRALEKNAIEKGCRIIIDLGLTYDKYGELARIVRLRTLLEFLSDPMMAEGKITVGLSSGDNIGHSITIVGDWFSAESHVAALGRGYRQTLFTSHAPTVRNQCVLFDEDLQVILDLTPEESRRVAIKKIRVLVEELETSWREGNSGAKLRSKFNYQ